jgi:hypothetical protein
VFLVSMFSTVARWVTIEARIVLARAFLPLGDVGSARSLTREAIDLLPLVADGEPLRARLAEIDGSTEAGQVPLGTLVTPVTPAAARSWRLRTRSGSSGCEARASPDIG